jgi:hypothetical protein
MAKRLLSTVSLPSLSTAPTGVNVGELYYNTSTKTVNAYDGTIWSPVSVEYLKEMFLGGNHQGVDIAYDNITNKLNLSLDLTKYALEPSGFEAQEFSELSWNEAGRTLSITSVKDSNYVFRGEYNNGLDYYPSDVVTYNGIYYVRINEPNPGYPPGTPYWDSGHDRLWAEEYLQNFVFFVRGKKFIKYTTDSISIPDDIGGLVPGTYYIYYTANGLLARKNTPFNFKLECPVAIIVVGEDRKVLHVGEERHGIAMDWATQYYLHRTFGTQSTGGFNIGNYVIGNAGTSEDDYKFSLTGGTIYDEDSDFEITHSATPTLEGEQILEPAVNLPVFYRFGFSGWGKQNPSFIPIYVNGSAVPLINEKSGTDWTSVPVENNQYYSVYIVATNNLLHPIISVMGQRTDNSLTAAKANNSYDSLDLTSLPASEFYPLYRLIFQHKNTYTNLATSTLQDVLDIRSISGSSGSGGGSTSIPEHGELIGLLDDDHTQYIHISNPRTIVANHIFNPTTPGAPFTLGANAQGYLVTGLNAEKLGGKTLSEVNQQAFNYASNAATDALAAAKGYTDQEIADLVGTAPAVLDTLGELADALADDANFASTVTTALSGKAAAVHSHTASSITDFTEAAQDAVATLFTHSNHSNVTATYDDENNKILFTVSAQLTQEQIQDYVSPLLAHNSHTNLNALYDDETNKIVLEAITQPSKAVMSATAPTNPADGAFWFDTDEYRSGTTRALKVWNALGSAWEYVSSDLSLSTTNVWTAKNTFNQGVIIGLSSAPSSPTLGQIYYDTTLQNLRVWNGSQWSGITGGGGGSAFQLISTDTTQVPAIMFFGASAPSSGTQNIGDLWIDIDDDAGDTEFIHVGPDAPDTYGSGTLWVDTDEPELPLIYSDEEPPSQTPIEGDFWVDIDDLAGQLVTVRETAPLPAESELWIDTSTEEGLETFTVANVYEGNRSVYNTILELPNASTHGGMIAYVEDNRSLYISRVIIPEYTLAATYNVTNNGMGSYSINGVANAPLIFERGKKYVFNINAPGHPFWIKTQQKTGIGFDWYYGVQNNGIDNGTIIFNVPYNAPDNLFYICQYHSMMTGSITVSGTVNITSSWEKLYPNNRKDQLEVFGYMGLL